MADAEAPEISAVDHVAASTLAKLHASAFTEAWAEAEMARWLAMPAVTALLAMRSGKPLGFVLALRATDQAEILTLAVDPGARRQGVGGALLDGIEVALADQGVATLYLEVAADNAAARALYAGRGYGETALRRGYYVGPGAPPVDASIMAKTISGALRD